MLHQELRISIKNWEEIPIKTSPFGLEGLAASFADRKIKLTQDGEAVVCLCRHLHKQDWRSKSSCTEGSHTSATKLVVSSVNPPMMQKQKNKKKGKEQKEKSIKFHKLFVLKYIFSVSDPQLFYWVESLGQEGFKKNNVAFPYVSGNTFYGNLSDCLWTNPLF